MHSHTSEEFFAESDKRRRTAMLQVWIQEDLDTGDEGLTTALRKWFDEIRPRLKTTRPILIRVPQLFVTHLGLSNQRALVTESHEVLEVQARNGRKARNVQTGRVLVQQEV
ncbi:hypothetical protein COU78_00145 [Candidatus Peregrinibacteria bacterium CG10_big_fil_rev_8_21_14_0_10_49_24]|nr:MAG: hypothetical protein COV83_06190 [Candidatus Peregrinibacteria bacterium CG11_big_fil_rev_8_21_14_0_20_49_14]PIR51599.1 MAG: hypothetical protein COU78_00145 [Candidatus Peregrinibacteria bacterium CG10_big_fil_rev_8_21_14_0_10_49_24]PJA68040.1 MAG: hypothetical protein CO157_01815 [Candidatus Peregrinibacteria bacterium CG_4_9_14_3_um_filter_49_12]